MSTDHWGTIDDTQERTGLDDVTDEELSRASAVVELVTGAIYAFTAKDQSGNTNSLLNGRDTYWINAATAYLVPFMRDHVDFLTRMQASAFSQDGQSVSLGKDSLVLPPLTQRALRRLSWRGTRTMLPSRLRRDTLAGQAMGPGNPYPILAPGQGVADYPAEIWVTETRG